MLWHAVAKSTTPLKRRKRASGEVAEPVAAEVEVEAAPSAPRAAAPPRAETRRDKPPPPPLAPIGRKEKARLSRGRLDIAARLDLHGMTQTRAHRALLAFLQAARDEGATFVLVITGRGRSSASEAERGVLRRQVPLWLELPEFRTLVVGFEQAHLSHGGEGALYVRLRRTRSFP